MTTRDVAPIGAPCWIDIYTSDPERTRAFYSELFGWSAEEAGPEYGGYFNFSKDGRVVAGGMVNDQHDMPDFWTVYLATDDADATTKAVEAHGGQVFLASMPVMTLGTMAVVVDPGGASVGVWQPAEHQGFTVFDEPGTPGWFELHTRAYDESVAFYRAVFAWDAHTAADEPGFRYTTLGEGEGQLAGIMDASMWHPDGAPATWSVYFRVADVDATIAAATDRGATIVQPAEDTPYGRLATLTDPTGATFKLRGA